MTKSRIKSEEEYNEILGVAPVKNEKEEKTTNDASQYFDELRDSKKEKIQENSNPFDRVISVEQIKENLKNTRNTDIEVIKAQIASAQKEVQFDGEEDSEVYVESAKYPHDNKKEFSFEDNARKLYENLRGSNLNKHTGRPTPPKEEPKKELDVVEPISISKERVGTLESSPELIEPKDSIETIQTSIPSVSSLQENFDDLKKEPTPADRLELTADFSMENENFMDAINQKKQNNNLLPKELELIRQKQEDNLETVLPEIETNIDETDETLDLVQELDEQMDYLDGAKTDAFPVEPVKEEADTAIPPVELAKEEMNADLLAVEPIKEEIDNHGIAEELESLTKPSPKNNLSNTLSLALDRDTSISFSPEDLKTLSEDELIDDKPKKGRVGEIVLTVSLIIMIIVVIFLLVKSFILE